MARVLFINVGSEGHINPTVGVVQELVARGDEVVYVCVEAFRERMERAGASLRTLDGQRFIQAFIAGGRRYVLERVNGLLHTADIVIPSVLEQLAGERFDYLIHDSMFGCGRLLAQMLKLPAICSCTSFAQTRDSFEREMASFFDSVPAEVAGPIQEQFERLAAGIQERYQVQVGSPYEVFCNPAPLTLVYTTRAFQPEGESFDASYRFVGPSIAPRFAAERLELDAVKGKSLLYISLGTVFNQAVDFYKLCFEALGDTEHTVVMAVGSRTPVSDLGVIPANFIVRPYVPQTELLPHVRLFVTHGGMNSVHEALYAGVPLVVVPQSADQPVIARQVARLGAGVALDMSDLSVTRLREAVDRVAGSAAFRDAAAAIGASFREAGGYRQAADELAAFTRP
ncbi:glycosyl transferase family 1 [Paenibacillus athensensis]|uniref:Glycosyl transferase family 1 n=1 Tax=Paenibacillus athensensis TaxID=1967502 RepID=A0A4Y8PTW7_9BACL|nr:macrolide family glycosyltransferase [Paenibacillus athensensis]MCD1261638.1 glycosyl transferase family 1 [Paenibacillus athensensis]